MDLELRDWRAMGLGWAAALAAVWYTGTFNWEVAVIAITTTWLVRAFWR